MSSVITCKLLNYPPPSRTHIALILTEVIIYVIMYTEAIIVEQKEEKRRRRRTRTRKTKRTRTRRTR